MKIKNNYTEQEKEMLKKYPKMFEPLDEEEKQIMEDFENDLYIDVDDPKKKEEYAKAANDYIRSKENKPITIRANSYVLEKIKNKAASYGMNYQTYINLFLYQLAEGKFTIQIK